MGVGFNVWCVPPTYVAGLYGAKYDEARTADLLASFADDFAEIDHAFEDQRARGELPSCADALGHILRGEYPSGVDGAVHAYVFECAARQWGRALPNDALMPCGSEFVDEVDHALAGLGVEAFRLSSLSRGVLPCPVPPVADFPGFGHLTATQCRAARHELDAVTPIATDPAVAAALDQIRSWLAQATKLKTTGLVAFFH